jgi:hypothetical protein
VIVALHALGLDAAHLFIVESDACLASVSQKRAHRVVGHISRTSRRSHGHALTQKREDLGTLGMAELVHAEDDTSACLRGQASFKLKF